MEHNSEQALEVINLVKDYDSIRAVNQVSFSIHQGEIFGLLGPNGAGKTSIISSIVTLIAPTSGSVKVFGQDVTKNPRLAKSLIGFVPQEIVNHGYFSVKEILKFHSGFYGLLKNREREHFLMEKLQLWDHRDKRVKQLSGGMKRRLLIAKSLVHSPRLLLLDEPTAGVDIELRNSLWSFVRELRQEGTSILLTTHYIDEAEQLCDRVGILQSGSLKRMGRTQDLIKDLTHRKVRIDLQVPISPVVHSNLIEQHETQLEFRLSSDLGLGKLLAELNLDQLNILDIKIQEGKLEDALTSVLKDKQ